MRRRRPADVALAVAAAAALSLGLAACGGGTEDTENTAQTLVVGVSSTQPGLGVRDSAGDWSGFEVDLARYLARGMGFTGSEVVFTEVVPANREQMLANGTVDMVLAQYPVPQPGAEAAGSGDSGEDDGDVEDDGESADPTDEADEPVVEFSTPYFTAHQDLLVRDGSGITDLASIDDPESVLCSVTGSGKAQRVKDDYAPGRPPGVRLLRPVRRGAPGGPHRRGHHRRHRVGRVRRRAPRRAAGGRLPLRPRGLRRRAAGRVALPGGGRRAGAPVHRRRHLGAAPRRGPRRRRVGPAAPARGHLLTEPAWPAEHAGPADPQDVTGAGSPRAG